MVRRIFDRKYNYLVHEPNRNWGTIAAKKAIHFFANLRGVVLFEDVCICFSIIYIYRYWVLGLIWGV